MKIAERIVIVLILIILIGGAAWFYISYSYQQKQLREDVADGKFEIKTASSTAVSDDWRVYYPELVPIIIGSTTVQASVADSIPERIKGLSGTPFLPDGVVKLFAFGTEGEHGIWMKDMKYPIDILWVEKKGKIVHVEENISPDTYPESFTSPKLAWYVIEANAGFVASTSLKVGDEVVVPKLR